MKRILETLLKIILTPIIYCIIIIIFNIALIYYPIYWLIFGKDVNITIWKKKQNKYEKQLDF